jgi:capsid protein
MQAMLLSQFVRPIYETWLQHVFEMRFVSLPSYRIDKFLKASKFIPRGWSWVDPDKEIRSAVTAIDRGLTSATRIAAEQGRDLVEVYDEIQAEREMAKERGLDFRSPDMIVANQAPAE